MWRQNRCGEVGKQGKWPTKCVLCHFLMVWSVLAFMTDRNKSYLLCRTAGEVLYIHYFIFIICFLRINLGVWIVTTHFTGKENQSQGDQPHSDS